MTPLRDVFGLVTDLIGAIDHGRARFAAALILATAASGSSVALMGVSAWLLSRAAEHPPVLYLLAAAVGVRFFGIGRGVFRYLERLMGHSLALRMQSALRMRTYDSLSRTTLLGSRHGDLLSRVTADVEAILDVVVRVALPFCSAAVVVLGAAGILTIFSPAFALVLLGLCVLAGVVAPILAARLSRLADLAAAPTRGELADQARELTRCATDLVAYGYQEHTIDRIVEVDGRLRAIESRGAWTRGLAGAAQVLAAGASVVAALIIGATAVSEDSLLGRDLAVLVLTPLALHEVFGDFTKAAQTLTRARSALGRVVDLLRAKPVGVGDRVFEDTGATGLHLDQVDVGWPGAQPVLRGVSLRLRPGERVALVGPSGLGKTTLAATIMGLIPPLAGQLSAPGRIGYLAQDAHIFTSTLEQNVKIGNKDADRERVEHALARAGLDLDPMRVVGEDGATLSGGEARRLALARLLVAAEPAELIILDEPTEHLDRETADALLDDLFAATSETALVVITHDEALMNRCERVVDLTRWADRTSR